MDRGPDDRSGPDPTADEFEAIVAGLRREGVPAWPSDDRPPAEPRTPPMAVPPVHPSWSGHVESDTDRTQRILRIWLAFWTAEVGHKDHFCALLAQIMDGRQAFADASVVSDRLLAVLLC